MEILTLNFSQLFEYLYFSYSFIDFPPPSLYLLVPEKLLVILKIGPLGVHVASANMWS